MSWVFKHSPYTLAARLIHLAMADVVNDDYGNRVFIGDAKIAAKARVSRGTVVRTKAQMIKDGYLAVIDDSSAPGKFTEYQFLMPSPNVSQSDTRRASTCASDDVNVRDLAAERARTTERDCLSTQEEPKVERNARSRGEGTDVVKRQYSLEEEFDIIWKLYPRKLNRKGAFRAYQATRRRDATPRDLWHATKFYAETVAGKPLDVVLHGSTFFGPNERWRDYLAGPLDEGSVTAGGKPAGGPGLLDLRQQIVADEQRKGIA